MLAYTVRRLLALIPTIFFASIIVFVTVRLIPGSVIDLMLANNPLAAVPIPDPVLEAARPQQVIAGEVPSVLNPPRGCRFHPRCPLAEARCSETEPQLRQTASGRSVACHLVAA